MKGAIMPRRKQRRNNPRRRLINQGDFLRLEQKLLEDESLCVSINPTRFLEFEEAVGNAFRADPDHACVQLV
jgi:hypothetical protein